MDLDLFLNNFLIDMHQFFVFRGDSLLNLAISIFWIVRNLEGINDLNDPIIQLNLSCFYHLVTTNFGQVILDLKVTVLLLFWLYYERIFMDDRLWGKLKCLRNSSGKWWGSFYNVFKLLFLLFHFCFLFKNIIKWIKQELVFYFRKK